jgi:hypothetical protein
MGWLRMRVRRWGVDKLEKVSETERQFLVCFLRKVI